MVQVTVAQAKGRFSRLRALLPEQACSGVETTRTMDLNAEPGERLKASPRD